MQKTKRKSGATTNVRLTLRSSTTRTTLYVGLDVFGPWEVSTRRTRDGSANSKRWAILFTCMSTRAVHIELIESMSASSCVNAIRGPAKQLRSDCGTNFIGASKDLKFAVEGDATVKNYLLTQGVYLGF